MGETCPRCHSRYRDIRGVIFPAGSYDSHPCEDIWHFGPDYDPEVLNLTAADRALLADLKVMA